ncbi:hypothetical protein AALO_G00102560 [Alosa alosa]|uniref:Uncharacterized protein n=1 Tax=Alosa alosa TaxID=278164 RepID=A0AAV6GWD5_9TELE|nr:hypothetical protein AALO_G00102560 [Alosa alosa]
MEDDLKERHHTELFCKSRFCRRKKGRKGDVNKILHFLLAFATVGVNSAVIYGIRCYQSEAVRFELI